MFHIGKNRFRKYEISIENNIFKIAGNFYCYKNLDLHKLRNHKLEFDMKDYLGIGRCKIKPYKQVVLFVSLPLIINLLYSILHNAMLKTIDYFYSLEVFFSVLQFLLNAVTILFIILGIKLLFSFRNIIEISFIGCHLCIPKHSISKEEYNDLVDAVSNY